MVCESAMAALLDAPSLNQQIRQLMHGHGVHHTAVISRDRVKILQTHPVFRAVIAIQAESCHRHIIAQRIMTCPPQGSQLPNRLYWLNSGAQPLIDTSASDRCATDYRLSSHPAVLLEVAGDTADGIVRVGPDINVAIAVEIHGVGAKAARHELRQ